jgi:putative ABC transport system ATP-binding protein
MIQLRGLSKTYATAGGAFPALRAIDLDIAKGEFVALVGRSGSGKSTLLHLIGGIDSATSGTINVAGADIHCFSEQRLAAWRGQSIGFVFQFFQLLPTLTVAENVMLPMDFAGKYTPAGRQQRAEELLGIVGVAEQAQKLPSTLSGGQQQRVAIARALANDPPVILADEPTGNLDSSTAQEVLALFRRLTSIGTTVVIATHEREISKIADRTIALADGALVSAPTFQETR